MSHIWLLLWKNLFSLFCLLKTSASISESARLWQTAKVSVCLRRMGWESPVWLTAWVAVLACKDRACLSH